jgi:hypothetical protein
VTLDFVARIEAAERALVEARWADFAAEAEALEAVAAGARVERTAFVRAPLARLTAALGHVRGVTEGLQSLRAGDGGYGPRGGSAAPAPGRLRAEA